MASSSSRIRKVTAAATVAVASLLGRPAHAAEGGLSYYPFGAQTTYAAFVPAPGTTSFFGYALYIDAGSVRDGKGESIPGVSVEAYALVPRFMHTWNSTFFGWKMTSSALVQALHVSVDAGGAKDRATGPSLFGLEPLYLSKTFGAWTFLHGPLIYLPLGNYHRNDLANSTLNYKSLAYQANLSWDPNPRLDVSLNAAIELKDENHDTNYRAGPQAGLSFGLGYKPFEDRRWDLGFSGFYQDGLADDEVDGKKVPGGGRTRIFAIGPKLAYWLGPAAAIVAQWHREYQAENAPRGDYFWVECTFPI